MTLKCINLGGVCCVHIIFTIPFSLCFSKSVFLMLADTILKKYSSTVATIFTGIASAALFGHALTINFVLGISIVFISMHQVNERERERVHSVSWSRLMYYISVQFFSPLSKIKDEPQNGNLEIVDNQNNQRCVLVHFGSIFKLHIFFFFDKYF